MSVAQGSFTLRREYDAPVEMVFKAFADPQAKARWFSAPVECTDVVREQDFRPGGRERLRATWPGGRITDFRAEYRDIAANQRIVYVYDMYSGERKLSVSLAIVTFETAERGTRLTVTEHGAFLDGYDDAGSREHGTGILLDRLGQSLTP